MPPANKSKDYIPVLKPSITEEEIASVVETMRSGWIGLGPKTVEFEKKFAEKVGARFCVGLNSCTAALHLAMASLGLSPGDEVIVTPMTFVSTVHAVVYAGATPVFADIQPDTLNIDPEDVAAKITPRTRAIAGVDMAGHPIDLDELTELAAAHGLALVEDAAHACGAMYKGRPVGSRPHLTCFSFHAVKNLTCGEGGAITCEHEWQDRWFREMRWLGISKDTWERTVEDLTYKWKYYVNWIGYKCHMNDLAAAIGLVQLKRLDELNKARREIVGRYKKGLAGLEWLTLPTERRMSGRPGTFSRCGCRRKESGTGSSPTWPAMGSPPASTISRPFSIPATAGTRRSARWRILFGGNWSPFPFTRISSRRSRRRSLIPSVLSAREPGKGKILIQ